MKIEDIRIGMKLRNPHAGRTGKVTKIECEGGLELVGNGLTWNEHVENVEPVGEFHVGDRVRQIGPPDLGFTDNMGQIGTIDREYKNTFDVAWDNGHGNTMPPTSIERVELCALHIGDHVLATGKSTTFEEDVNGKIGIIDSFMNDVSGDKCADIRWLCGSSNLVKVAQLTPLAHGEHFHCDHFRPLAEVAKCYIQVEPERLFLSQNAKRIIEFLAAMDTPITLYHIAEAMRTVMPGAAVLDGLIEAREAGIVRLDEGKYSLVRD